jgi:redox-regulated HSP33 family molecular chaperone
MSTPRTEIPSRAPSAVAVDDIVLPFEVSALDLRGRVVRLGPVVDEILEKHDYPQPVAKLLGEAIVLTVMLGTALKFDGRFILQTQADGPVRMLVVDFTAPSKVRACARFDKARVAEAIAAGNVDAGALLGKGHLAMTIDQGPDMSRYQGLALVSTVEDVELIDPSLSSERLVYRLFHEPGVRVFEPGDVRAECSCSRETVESMLKSFSQDDRDHMVEDGKISVTCEFCSATYAFAPDEVGAKAE